LEIYLIHSTNDTESNFICNVNIAEKTVSTLNPTNENDQFCEKITYIHNVHHTSLKVLQKQLNLLRVMVFKIKQIFEILDIQQFTRFKSKF